MSPVQVFALELLLYADGHRRQEDFRTDLRLSLVASGTRTVQSLWPEWFGPAPIADVKEEVDAEDYANVEWVSPMDGEDFDEMMALAQELANSAISVTDTGGGEWV